VCVWCLRVSVYVTASTIDPAASSVCLHIYMQCMDTREYVVYECIYYVHACELCKRMCAVFECT